MWWCNRQGKGSFSKETTEFKTSQQIINRDWTSRAWDIWRTVDWAEMRRRSERFHPISTDLVHAGLQLDKSRALPPMGNSKQSSAHACLWTEKAWVHREKPCRAKSTRGGHRFGDGSHNLLAVTAAPPSYYCTTAGSLHSLFLEENLAHLYAGSLKKFMMMSNLRLQNK